MHKKIEELTHLNVYPDSLCQGPSASFFLGRRDTDMEKFVGSVGDGGISGQTVGELDSKPVTIGPLNHANAQAIRSALPWTAPKVVGLATSAGLGDRLGLATPGHARAMGDHDVVPIFAQQSIREMTRTNRTADQVMDCATWGVLQEGFQKGFGSDADHLQELADIDVTVAAGFTMFTIDPGKHVRDAADSMDAAALAEAFETVDFATLATSASDLKCTYVGKTISLAGGVEIDFDESTFLRAAVKYGNAIAHVVKMYRHLVEVCDRPFELEVSVDETESPTSTAEHYFFAAELKRLGVKWVSMAPRFVGRFEKGVDYIGDLDIFRASLAEHVAVMRTVGPYKMSIHSGSDKFSVYPIVTELAEGLVHLKTAGTSYLEALRAITKIDPGLFREILDFSRGRYETDRATYHVSAELAKVPEPKDLTDDQLPALLDDFDAREVLHVTYGSVLTADGGERFRTRLVEALCRQEQTHYAALERHLSRHIEPLAR